MEQLVIYLLLINFLMIVWVMRLKKQNDILHNNNVGLGQVLVNEGLMTQDQFERSMKKCFLI